MLSSYLLDQVSWGQVLKYKRSSAMVPSWPDHCA
jgi:hypothetical protein